MAKRLSLLDRSFWLTETTDNPKHVACLQILTKPEGAADDYCQQLANKLRQHDQGVAPYNQRVIAFGHIALRFKAVTSLNMEYHVKFHQVEDIKDKVALHNFTAKLHEPMLDRDKPLWQLHIIEAPDSQEFAIYFKIHHMYGDGASLITWLQAAYPKSADEEFIPFWAKPRESKPRVAQNPFAVAVKALWLSLVTVVNLGIITFFLLLKILRINPVYMPIPFAGTKTMLTGQVTAGRVVATTHLDFTEVKKLAIQLRASVNEVFLCCFDIGVHKFLKDHGQQFGRPLITQMPINLRRPGEAAGGNKIAILPVQLAYGQKDPYRRLRQIIENHSIVKKVARRINPAALTAYTIVIQGFALVFEALKLSDLHRPIGNILISNVPGPRQDLYFGGSRVNNFYPISVLTPGGGVNITLLTYRDKAEIGLVCSDRKIKSLEPLASYFQEAFELLSDSVNNPELTTDDLGELARFGSQCVIEDEFQDNKVNVA
ncbi:wax ester/triacylglycerol synthase domain-containing protein [Thalassotalea euphylliae]|uniref:diacylglycerol O-acyltransferase n=1 Tax=Thalassotalea euphylliae TaxID=1655234 RepID=A0A3E0UH69_9GAMM|nr:wax ester/triacylglycerol synthase domain-containing protein [Thalassotalea euphylliae]REL36229.1 DUF1298 domain-containing protein [Thalassotalea euphylliae]